MAAGLSSWLTGGWSASERRCGASGQVLQEALDVVVGAQEDKDRLVPRQAKKDSEGEADTELPEIGGMQIPQSQATMASRVGKGRFQVEEGVQYRGPVLRPGGAELAEEPV